MYVVPHEKHAFRRKLVKGRCLDFCLVGRVEAVVARETDVGTAEIINEHKENVWRQFLRIHPRWYGSSVE